MKAVIDRFEENFAIVVLEDNRPAIMSRILLPDAKEGDVVEITINASEREIIEERIEKKVNKLFE